MCVCVHVIKSVHVSVRVFGDADHENAGVLLELSIDHFSFYLKATWQGDF